MSETSTRKPASQKDVKVRDGFAFSKTQPKAYEGVHCETVATGTLLLSQGITLSEPMLFGLGEGLGFIFLNLSSLPLPFLGGRSKPFELTRAVCRNLGATCAASETTSKAKAWAQLEAALKMSRPVGLQLDCFYLNYFKNPPHFAGHFVAATRLVGNSVEVVDTTQQGGTHLVPRQELESARHAKGPMSANARQYTIESKKSINLAAATLGAMRNNAKRYLRPEFSGMGAMGIRKLAKSLPTWLDKAESPKADLSLAAQLMEKAGTGGALFRNLYRDFLTETAELFPARKSSSIRMARDAMATSAGMWSQIAALVERCANDGNCAHLVEAASLCAPIIDCEVRAMKSLIAQGAARE